MKLNSMNKRAIYEQIMNKLSVIVKQKLDEFADNASGDELYLSPEELVYYINSIPEKNRIAVQESFLDIPSFGRNVNNPLLESISNSDANFIYEPEFVVDSLIEKYGFQRWQFNIKKAYGDVLCVIFIPEDKRISKELKESFKKLGYYLGIFNEIEDNSGLKWKVYQFEPYHQTDMSTEIRKYKLMYHITPATNLYSIKRRGLLAHSSEQFLANKYSYPERVYLVYDSKKSDIDEEVRRLAVNIYKKRSLDNPLTENVYAIITLITELIPDDIEMFYDPNYKSGVFVENDIPAEAIADIEFYDCVNKRDTSPTVWQNLKSKILYIFKR